MPRGSHSASKHAEVRLRYRPKQIAIAAAGPCRIFGECCSHEGAEQIDRALSKDATRIHPQSGRRKFLVGNCWSLSRDWRDYCRQRISTCKVLNENKIVAEDCCLHTNSKTNARKTSFPPALVPRSEVASETERTLRTVASQPEIKNAEPAAKTCQLPRLAGPPSRAFDRANQAQARPSGVARSGDPLTERMPCPDRDRARG